jgi:hypothetical protein
MSPRRNPKVVKLGRKRDTPPSKRELTKQLDQVWSQLVRSRGECEKCGARDKVLHAAHIYGRANRRLRWDPRNSACLCARCHLWWAHKEPLEFTDWIRSHRPEDCEYLRVAAQEVSHYTAEDYQRMLSELRSQLQALEEAA